MINSIFYILALLFIWNEFYYTKNLELLNSKFKERELNSFTKLDMFYYLTRVLYCIWLVIGSLTIYHNYFLGIIALSITKFIIYPIGKTIYKPYDLFVSIGSAIGLLIILYFRFIG